jgi:predicted transcriptional regulator
MKSRINKIRDEVMKWIVKDVSSKNQVLTHTIFTAEELKKAASVELSVLETPELINKLLNMQIIQRTNKIAPEGIYYNVHLRVYNAIHKTRTNRRFLKSQESHLLDGFCFTKTKVMTHRLICAGRECKFYFPSEKVCFQNKFFMQ